MARLLITMTKGQILDMLAAEEDVPLVDGRRGVTTDAGEAYLASLEEQKGSCTTCGERVSDGSAHLSSTGHWPWTDRVYLTPQS